MSEKVINILALYPRDMNVYGDQGNLVVLERRLKMHGFKPNLIEYNVGDDFPQAVDIVLGGGGQDSNQSRVHQDLIKISDDLKTLAEHSTPMLMICGLYQLFGHRFIEQNGHEITGIGILDVETSAGDKRFTGNIITENPELGYIIGYENHSGQTILGKDVRPFANIISGVGNNLTDRTEGAQHRNVIGSYLHGPILAKNPRLTDWLIMQAALNKFGDFKPSDIDDSLVDQAREVAMKLKR